MGRIPAWTSVSMTVSEYVSAYTHFFVNINISGSGNRVFGVLAVCAIMLKAELGVTLYCKTERDWLIVQLGEELDVLIGRKWYVHKI